MPKEFKTNEELVKLLESRGVITDGKTLGILRRESYYAIVNGYKGPFLDYAAMQSSAEDVFLGGTEFRWMYDLFIFDRDLRSLTFRYLTRAEAVFRTAVAYAFCHNHPSGDAYLDRASFCKPDEMLLPRSFKRNKREHYTDNLARLMTTLNEKLRVTGHSRGFIKHYMRKYGFVPLWVLANDLTFGNMVHFYQLMQPKDRDEVARIVAQTSGFAAGNGRYLSPRNLLRSARLLVDFRNMCAHDERLYCAKVGNDDFGEMVAQLRIILPNKEVDQLKGQLAALYAEYSDRLHNITFESLFGEMGFAVDTADG